MFKDRLENIRNSDDATKKKWLYIFSGGAIFIVIIVWVLYMNAFVFKNAMETNNTVIEKEKSGVEFWPTFKTGLSVIINNIEEKIADLFSSPHIPKIGGENKVKIENPN